MEVVESLHRGFEEKVPCENLILEINSSRYAYNVILKDVTNLTVKAILSIPERVGGNMKAVLTHFLPLFKNYVKTPESQLDCLDVMEVSGPFRIKCALHLSKSDTHNRVVQAGVLY